MPGTQAAAPRPGFANPPQALLLGLVLVNVHPPDMRPVPQAVLQRARLAHSFVAVRAAELDQQPGSALRQQRDVPFVEALGVHVLHQQIVDRFDADRAMRAKLRNEVGGVADVVKADDDQNPARGRYQDQLRPQDGDTGAFAADQRAGDIEAVLRQQLIEVVPGDPARDVRIPRADFVGVAIPQVPEPAVNVGASAPLRDDRRELLLAGRPDRQL